MSANSLGNSQEKIKPLYVQVYAERFITDFAEFGESRPDLKEVAQRLKTKGRIEVATPKGNLYQYTIRCTNSGHGSSRLEIDRYAESDAYDSPWNDINIDISNEGAEPKLRYIQWEPPGGFVPVVETKNTQAAYEFIDQFLTDFQDDIEIELISSAE